MFSKTKVLSSLFALAIMITAGCGSGNTSIQSIKSDTSISSCNSYLSGTILSWNVPTIDLDGYPLTKSDIVGYKIYYNFADNGNNAGSYSISASTMNIDVRNTAQHLNLPSNKYMILITAIGASGGDIAFSDRICTNINTP